MRLRGAARVVLGVFLTLGAPGLSISQTQIGGTSLEGSVETGLRFFVDEPSSQRKAKLEEYRDLPNGPFLHDLRLRLSQPGESYSLEFEGSKWGQEDQRFSLTTGRLGLWQFGFEWDQIPHIYSTNARLLATETSRGVYTLDSPRPPLADHDEARRLDEVGVRWDTAHLFTRLRPAPGLDLTAEYTRRHKGGDRPMGMAFGSAGNNFYEVLEPIEQTTHDFEVRGALAKPRWQLQFGYLLSVFENGLQRLRADNPCFSNPACGFDGGAAAPETGQSSLPPSNMAHTFNLGGGINLPMRTRVNANLAYSLRLQNAAFLPHTINPALAGNPDLVLPEQSLGGLVNLWQLHTSATTQPLEPLTLALRYRFHEYDDQSRTLTFPGVVVDDWSQGPARRAGRFSWQRQNVDLDARLYAGQPAALTLGVGWEYWNRGERREVPESDEFFAKAALDVIPSDWFLARLTYRPSLRRINEYNAWAYATSAAVQDPATALAGQSVLLRKFDEAERDRQKAELLLQLTPTRVFTATHTLGWRYDDYVSSPLGLQWETTWSAGVDVTWTPAERVSLSAGYTYELIEQRMRSRSRPVSAAGVSDFEDFDWISVITDTVQTAHAGLTAVLLPRMLDLTLSGTYSTALGRTATRNPVSPAPHAGVSTAQVEAAQAKATPPFEDALVRLEAALKYHITGSWTASLGYVFESFEKADWRTDELNPFMPGQTSIWLGNDLKSYTAHIVGATFSYRFR